jgi:hypothetical protein
LLTSPQNLAVLIFFIPFVVFQLPATTIVRFMGPRAYLPTLGLLWGIVGMVWRLEPIPPPLEA